MLYQGDCLEVMDRLIEEGIKVDAIITDIPYGTTACKWDSIIPFDDMWNRLKLLRNDRTPIVLFGSEPFSSALRMSNIKEYKYDWVWDKEIPSGMSFAKYQPMRRFENIHIFGKNSPNYYPQMVLRDKPIKGGGMGQSASASTINYKPLKKTYTHKNPTNIIVFDKIRRGSVHPTQKPVALMEYLIKTYTNEGDTVLDFTMGSGSTGVACKKLGRNFIGIELDEGYFNIAKERIGRIVKNE